MNSNVISDSMSTVYMFDILDVEMVLLFVKASEFTSTQILK